MNGAKRRKVEYIAQPKERASRFIKRKKGLINKANELSILCGVDCCVIIINQDDHNNLDSVHHVWSSSNRRGLVGDLISKYKRERGPKRVFNDSGAELAAWSSKFESMNGEELRNLAGGLEIKLDRMKKRRELMMRNKRVKTAIPCNDGCNLDMDEAVVDVAMNLIEDDVSCDLDMSPLPDEAIVRDQFEMAMNSVEDNVSCNFGMTPMPGGAVVWDQLEMAMNSIEDIVSCNLHMNPMPGGAFVRDQLEMAMNSIEDNVSCNLDMAMNSIEDNVSCNLDMNPMPGEAIVRDQLILIEDNMGYNLQPNAMKKVDDVNGMTLPISGDNLTDLQQQCLYDPSNPFVKDGSGGFCLWKFSTGKLCSGAIIRLASIAAFDALILFDGGMSHPRCNLLNNRVCSMILNDETLLRVVNFNSLKCWYSFSKLVLSM
ncbi:hypothetical protein ACET3Z_024872 [Daucus carota]